MKTTTNEQLSRPNIIFILADDMGYGDIGCYNPESKIPTPHMDSLAQEGIRFTDMHSPSAVCTPTRYGIMTGRYCWRTPLENGVLYNYEKPLIPRDRLTIASMLKSEGYHTACIGKWHLGLEWGVKDGCEFDFDQPLPWASGAPDPADEAKIDFSQPILGGPIELGFDYFYGTSGCSTAQPPYGFIENDKMVTLPTVRKQDGIPGSRDGMMTLDWDHSKADTTFTEKAIQYLENHAKSHPSEPFFMYLSASAPHEPAVWGVIPEFVKGKSDAGPRGDLVVLFDWMVGEVMQKLDDLHMNENTLFIITSDNGALPGHSASIDGRPSWDTFGHKSTGDWRGYKSHIWEGGHREPFIARWPNQIKPGSISSELTCLNDMLATMANIVGVSLPVDAGEDSVNLLPSLLGESYEQPLRKDLIHHSGSGVFSIRQGEWKLILETKTSGGWPPPRGEGPIAGSTGQLYHLEADPREENDLFEQRPDIVESLAGLLNLYRNSDRSV